VDGGAGGCFPAGHASAAFAYVGGYFVLRRASVRAAALWLSVALVAGLVLGVSQQMRGAHYMSHTLWTAWICWVVGFAIELVATRLNPKILTTAVPAHAGS
jgi:membrane-associated PAP2 superfamily phosphatase